MKFNDRRIAKAGLLLLAGSLVLLALPLRAGAQLKAVPVSSDPPMTGAAGTPSGLVLPERGLV